MNKIVAILGIIIVIMLGGLFFCAGFFTGSTMSPSGSSATADAGATGEKTSSKDDVDALLETKSESISQKVMDLLASAADSAISTAEDLATKKDSDNEPDKFDDEQMTVDSLLREIASSHTRNDDCSPQTTQAQMDAPKPANLQQGMQGKKIVFIGYFKNKVALQIQQLLQGKGYKTHVEISKAGEQDEAFVFCGPFRQEKVARKLVTWLRRHGFKEARLISVSKEAVEETLYDFIGDDSKLPANTEKDIPEVSEETVQMNVAQPVAVPQQTVMPQQMQQPMMPQQMM